MSRSLATPLSVLVLIVAALAAKDVRGQEPFRSLCGAGDDIRYFGGGFSVTQ